MTHDAKPTATAGHGHDDSIGHDHPTGLRGAIKEVFAPHSHDASDSIDGALESSAAGIRAVQDQPAGIRGPPRSRSW